MEKLNMPEQSTNNSASETVAPTAAESDELNLLEVMEICSDLCVTHPFRLLQILEECAASPEISALSGAMAEIMWLRFSPFGKRLTQIH